MYAIRSYYVFIAVALVIDVVGDLANQKQAEAALAPRIGHLVNVRTRALCID